MKIHQTIFEEEMERLAAEKAKATEAGMNGEVAGLEPSTNGCHVPGDQAPKDDIHLTDLGNAKTFAKLFGDRVRYCHPWKKWLVWNERYWEPDTTGEAVRLAKQTVVHLFQQAEELLKRVQEMASDGDDEKRAAIVAVVKKRLAWALKSEDAKRIEALLKLAQSEFGIPVVPEQLDAKPWLLNLQNGTLDLKTGKLRHHDKRDYFTRACPVSFDPAATCPTFDRALTNIFPETGDAAEEPGDPEMIPFVLRLLGRCLTGDTSEHILAVLWGSGANGKSVLLETVSYILGPFAGPAAEGLLLARRGERHQTEVADLHGLRLVVSAESGEGARLDESRVKRFTGGDTIKGRRMREDFWSFKPEFKLFLVSNHKPRIHGTDEGIWRRVLLVPFLSTFWNPDKPAAPGEEWNERFRQDKQLVNKLKAEASGILNRLMAGCLDWQKNGLGEPERVRIATAEYRDAEDSIRQFIEDRCRTSVDDAVRTKASVLYSAYKAWAEATGEKVVSQKVFGRELEHRDYERKVSNGVWYLRLALLGDDD